MANFQDQAKAIWNALDTMLEKDPESYKKFITEQMCEGKSAFNRDNPFARRDKSSASQCKDLKSSNTTTATSGARASSAGAGKRVPVEKLTKSKELASHANSLTDDAIFGASSLFAQMVISKPEVDEEEPEIAINELKIPTDVRAPAIVNTKKKPLIEEL